MNRRAFLQTLGAAAAAVAIDPERLLWEPGKKVIVDLHVPARKIVLADPLAFRRGDIITFEGMYLRRPDGVVTDHLKQFVVTADVEAGRPIDLTPVLHPPIVERGPYANVYVAVPTDAVRLAVGSGGRGPVGVVQDVRDGQTIVQVGGETVVRVHA